MQEPPLFPHKDKNVAAYRFVWLRAFHPPVSVRLWQTGNQRYLTTKQLSDVGVPINGEALFPKTLVVNKMQSITEAEGTHFQELLQKVEFWSIPTVDDTPIGFDGAGWLLEGVSRVNTMWYIGSHLRGELIEKPAFTCCAFQECRLTNQKASFTRYTGA